MDKRKVYTLDADLLPIMKGDVALPNPEPIKGDLASTILHYSEMHVGHALIDGKKEWHVRYFLDYGQGGGLEGSGVVAWCRLEKGFLIGTGLKFAICQHTKVADPGANPSRGWHPGRCSKCDLDMTIDSGD